MTDTTQAGLRPETEMEHIARDMREGRFPDRSPRQIVDLTASQETAPVDPWALMDKLRLQHQQEIYNVWMPLTEEYRNQIAELASNPPSAAPTDNTALVEAVKREQQAYRAYERTPEHRNGVYGTKALAYQLWMEARADVGAALASRPAASKADTDVAAAAKLILSQPKVPNGPNAAAFRVACAYLDGQESGAETTNEIIEAFLKTLAGEND